MGKLKHEIQTLTLATLFFGSWIGLALVGASVLSKVVLVLEHVPLGAWVRSRPAWVDVPARARF